MSVFPFEGDRHQDMVLPIPTPELQLSIRFDQGTRRFVTYLENRDDLAPVVAIAFVPEGDLPRISSYRESSRQMLHVGGTAFAVTSEASACLDAWLAQLHRLNLQTASPNPALCRAQGGSL